MENSRTTSCDWMNNAMQRDEWENLVEDVRQIKLSITGDDLGNRGLARRLSDCERAISLMTFRVVTVSGFVSGAIWAVKALTGH